MKKISILVPCYNEEENVIPLSNALVEMLQRDLPAYDYEIVFIDNCSKDSTRDKLRVICRKNPKIKYSTLRTLGSLTRRIMECFRLPGIVWY